MGGNSLNILVVRSVNRGISSFIVEQINSLRKQNITVDVFDITGTGKAGYLKNILPLRKRLKEHEYQLIHAHGGLSGLLANMQRKVPVVTTFHGTDVNLKGNTKYSIMAAWLSRYNILTNKKLNDILKLTDHYSIIPCGIDLENFKPMDRDFCKRQMGLSAEKNYILFSSSFNRPEKNAELAQKAVAELENTELIELKDYTRQQVNLLINASQLLLMTSYYESAPLTVKEALACNRPVVSTDVGDVKAILKDVPGSYLVDFGVQHVVDKCRLILKQSETYESREAIKKYALPIIAEKIEDVYRQIIREPV